MVANVDLKLQEIVIVCRAFARTGRGKIKTPIDEEIKNAAIDYKFCNKMNRNLVVVEVKCINS